MTTKEKALILDALLDLWKGQGRGWRAKKAVKDWSSDELMIFLEHIVKLPSNEFTIIYTRSRKWCVTYIWHEEESTDLKIALFRHLQFMFEDGKVRDEAKEGIDPKYLDFHGKEY